jgi:hypothetical protein
MNRAYPTVIAPLSSKNKRRSRNGTRFSEDFSPPAGTPFGSNREVVLPLPRDDAEGARG